jgi:outer membrane protein assembly factor BamB
MFHVASSPIVVDGLCIAQLGGPGNGGIVAYDLAGGNEKWKWTGDGPAYASPVLLTVGGAKAIVTETQGNVVAIGAADGKLLWKTPFAAGRMQYNAATPMVDGQTVIYSGSGRAIKAVKMEKKGDEIATTELWSTSENNPKFNTPVLKDGLVYGISEGNKLFCAKAETGKAAWSTALGTGGGGGGGGRMGGRGGYGSVVDAGPVLFALTPSGQLVVFEPSDKEYKEIAKYKVGAETYAYPVVSGSRVFVKDKDSVTLWTID